MSEQTSTATNGLAIAAAVLGITSAVIVLLGIPYGVIGGVVALITGLLGIQKAQKLGGAGLGLAITGTVIGGIIVLILAWVALN